MPIFKPAVSTATATVVASGGGTSSPCELVAVHYLNTTAGVGRIDIYDGAPTANNLRITLGAAVINGTDDFSPSQPVKFSTKVNVQFTTGTGAVTLTIN